MNHKLKIVHCANFSYFKNGEVFYSTDRKVTHGLIELGHFVYDFSYRDQAKGQRFLAFKKASIKRMNQDLIDTCINIKPDLLLLAKSEMIFSNTLMEIKKILPKIKIAKWFVDFLDRENKDFFEQFNYIDYFFQTSAAKLEELSEQYKDLCCSYIPNITDKAFDKLILKEKKEYDLIYIARDHKEDVRHKFAVKLDKFCKDNKLKLKLYASLGNPPIFGQKYYEEISKAKIAINFNRTDLLEGENKNKFMGSSDRMNHFMGTGTCTFSPKIRGLDILYENEQDLVYFDGIEDCFSKILFYLAEKRYEKISLSGNKKVYKVSNTKKIAAYLVETILEQSYSQSYEWSDLRFKNGKSF